MTDPVQEGFQPSKENNSEQFRLISSEFPSLDRKGQFRDNNSEKIKASPEFQSLEPEGRPEKVEQKGFKPLIVNSTQENDSEKFKLTKFQIEFQKRLSLNHKGYQEKNQGFQPLIVSPSKENLSEQFRLNPKFEWARLDQKDCQDEQEKKLQEGLLKVS